MKVSMPSYYQTNHLLYLPPAYLPPYLLTYLANIRSMPGVPSSPCPYRTPHSSPATRVPDPLSPAPSQHLAYLALQNPVLPPHLPTLCHLFVCGRCRRSAPRGGWQSRHTAALLRHRGASERGGEPRDEGRAQRQRSGSAAAAHPPLYAARRRSPALAERASAAGPVYFKYKYILTV